MNDREEYYLEPYLKEIKDGIQSWSKEDLINLIVEKADSDHGFLRLIKLRINSGSEATSKLKKRWNLIQENVLSLSYEKYIDDQQEIADIWELCYEIIRFLDENECEYDDLKVILQDILVNEYYDHVGCYDPMEELSKVLFDKLEDKGRVA